MLDLALAGVVDQPVPAPVGGRVPGLAHQWIIDDGTTFTDITLVDAVGGINGTVQNTSASWPEWVASGGRWGGTGLRGAGDAARHVTIPNLPSLNGSNYTVCWWIIQTIASLSRGFAVDWSDGVASPAGAVAAIMHREVGAPTNSNRVYGNAINRGTPSGTCTALDIWCHHSITWNGANGEYFTDGISALGPWAEAGGAPSASDTIRLFSTQLGANHAENMIVSDLRVYNRALSASEILTVMTGANS